MSSWLNADGLYIKYGQDEVKSTNPAGEYRDNGPQRYVELVLEDLTKLTTTAVIQNDVVTVPAGAVIQKVEVIADVAATSGGSATLNVGLTKDTDRSTAISDTALVSAMALTAINAAGDTVELTTGATGAGAKVGTTIGTTNGLLTAKYATAAFTAGKVTVRVFYTLNAV